jgi:hypothetical protein
MTGHADVIPPQVIGTGGRQRRVKKVVMEKGGGVTLEIIKTLAVQVSREFFLGPGSG